MQNSDRRHGRGLISGLLCACVISLPTDASAQARDHVSLAQALVRAAFPDLSGDVTISLNPGPSHDWRMSPLTAVNVRTFDPSAPDHSRVVLSVSIQATNGVLMVASFYDAQMHADRVGLFRTAQERGGDVASNVISELRSRGAKHLLSSDDLLAALNLKRFSSVIGEIQNARARLQAVPPFQVGPEVGFWPTWIVDVTTVQKGASWCYWMLVDPITVNPTSITQTDCKTVEH